MTSIRIAIAAALAVGALLAGASSAAHHLGAARTTVASGVARSSEGVIGCCDDE